MGGPGFRCAESHAVYMEGLARLDQSVSVSYGLTCNPCISALISSSQQDNIETPIAMARASCLYLAVCRLCLLAAAACSAHAAAWVPGVATFFKEVRCSCVLDCCCMFASSSLHDCCMVVDLFCFLNRTGSCTFKVQGLHRQSPKIQTASSAVVLGPLLYGWIQPMDQHQLIALRLIH